MYTGSSISIAAIIEHLLNMARDLEDLAHLSWRLAKESSSVEELEKAYRQEVTRGKERIEEMKLRLFEYMASGRIEVVENSVFYLNIALSLERAAQSLDASVYRLLLYANLPSSSREGAEMAAELYAKAKEALNYLSSALRVLQNMGGADRERYRLLDQRLARVKVAEEEADVVYRRIIAYSITEHKPSCDSMTILKDLADYGEAAMDYIAEAGDYVRLLGVSIYSR
ncbi:MAG: hypothetical protein GSR86_03065 [Desulfurococcales archaeon]|nr:hypothetical protein [Desulfurococcales archaeon]